VKPQVVGRDEPLAALDRFIEGIAERPASLTIAGAAGIGKTTVWQAGVEAAEARGYCVLASRPSSAEATLAYSGLADLLAHVDRRHVDSLPEPQRGALDIALLIARAHAERQRTSSRPPRRRPHRRRALRQVDSSQGEWREAGGCIKAISVR